MDKCKDIDLIQYKELYTNKMWGYKVNQVYIHMDHTTNNK